MNNKIYVGNLAYGVDSDQLRDKFTEHGQVTSAKVITDRDTGRSKGFGFVEMESGDMAQSAIENLDGSEWEGRRMNVKEAKPRENNRNDRFNR